MAIQELSREEVSAVSGGAGLVEGVLTLVGKLTANALVANLLKVVSKITGGLLGGLKL